MQTYARACRRAAQLREIAQLVGDPEPAAAGIVGFGSATAGERIGEMPLVVHITDQRLPVCPQSERAAARAVSNTVGSNLVHREHEVGRAGLAHTRFGCEAQQRRALHVQRHAVEQDCTTARICSSAASPARMKGSALRTYSESPA